MSDNHAPTLDGKYTVEDVAGWINWMQFQDNIAFKISELYGPLYKHYVANCRMGSFPSMPHAAGISKRLQGYCRDYKDHITLQHYWNANWVLSLAKCPDRNEYNMTLLDLATGFKSADVVGDLWKAEDAVGASLYISFEMVYFTIVSLMKEAQYNPNTTVRPRLILFDGSPVHFRELSCALIHFETEIQLAPIPNNRKINNIRTPLIKDHLSELDTLPSMPLTTIPNQNFKLQRLSCCSHCKSTDADKYERCSKCAIALYCSKQCQKDDWKAFHSKECSVFVQSNKLVDQIWNEMDWDDMNFQ